MSELASLDLDQEQLNANNLIKAADTIEALEEVRVKFLGKNGLITSKLKLIATLAPDERKTTGAKINQIKNEIEACIESKKTELNDVLIEKQLQSEAIDITLPARARKIGQIHPISEVIDQVVGIFSNMGFNLESGPEIEDDFHNFTALNIPENHPARQMQDSFYLVNESQDLGKPGLLLRTHTSSVQVRAIEKAKAANIKPPYKFIAPGRVYRSDMDMTHTPMFHQIEGFYIDKNINMGHLKQVLYQFLQEFFEINDLPIRFRPSFFPFTEPSAEVDIGCSRAGGNVKVGAGEGWLEILGCGMVHRKVLENLGIDPEEYQGFAFGVGIERLAMLKYGAPDLREFFDSDVRWLKHYGF